MYGRSDKEGVITVNSMIVTSGDFTVLRKCIAKMKKAMRLIQQAIG